jgi:predicted nuclease with TOPRIM domain
VLPVKSFELGRMVIEGDRAEIETRVEMAGDTPMNLQLTTVLVRAGSVWRIDYEATVRDISRDSELAKILEQLRQLGARVGADLNRSIDELKNAIPKLESELSKIEKDIRAQVPELRKRLEELAKELRAPPPGSTTHRDYRRAI